jgi:hypothetical protein
MSDKTETIVVVTDKGSATFQKVGDSAQKMGTQIDQAGTTGERGLKRLSKAGAVTGAAITALSGTLTCAGEAVLDGQASSSAELSRYMLLS